MIISLVLRVGIVLETAPEIFHMNAPGLGLNLENVDGLEIEADPVVTQRANLLLEINPKVPLLVEMEMILPKWKPMIVHDAL